MEELQKLEKAMEKESEIICENGGILLREDKATSASKDLHNLTVSPLATSQPSRRLTRSQTGRVPKRSRVDTSPIPEVKKRVTRPPKKSKPAYEVCVDLSDGEMIQDKPDFTSSCRQDASSILVNDADATRLRDMTASSSSTTEGPECHGAKSRANLPVPVPNLTKKSRGRRVPTRLPNDDTNIDPKDTRVYVCKVESCGKCFHRGEHLKRHIRSIHTHEKPFKCTFPLCTKNFNRHDNLLQHLKVHKELATPESSNADDSGSPVQLRQSTPPPLSVAAPPQLQPYYSAQHAYEPRVIQSRISTIYDPPTTSFRTYAAPYGSLSEPASFTTNMAVSSLRTELPQSPPTSRRHVEPPHCA